MKVIFFAIAKLLIIIFLGFYLYRRKIFSEDALKFLTFFVVNLSVPFLIFTKIISTFDPNKSPHLLFFLFLSFFIFGVGLISGAIFLPTITKTFRREFLALVSFQNCGYLPMNLAIFLLPSRFRDTFLVYIFLYILGFNILMWSIGSFFIFKKRKDKFQFTSLFTMPIVSIIVSLIFVYSGLNKFIPSLLISPLKMIGDTSFPLSMIILGAWLGKVRGSLSYIDLAKASFAKLIIVPAVLFFLLIRGKVSSLLGLFVILEASMPSAASLPIIVELRGGDSKFVSGGVFISHLLSIITIPLWFYLFSRFTGIKL